MADFNEVMYGAFSDEMEKIALGLGIAAGAGLGVGGMLLAGSAKKRWKAANKELAEQRIEEQQKRLARMQAMHEAKYASLGMIAAGTGLGVGGTMLAGNISKRYKASTKELAEQRIEDQQKRLARMQAMTAAKYGMQ